MSSVTTRLPQPIASKLKQPTKTVTTGISTSQATKENVTSNLPAPRTKSLAKLDSETVSATNLNNRTNPTPSTGRTASSSLMAPTTASRAASRSTAPQEVTKKVITRKQADQISVAAPTRRTQVSRYSARDTNRETLLEMKKKLDEQEQRLAEMELKPRNDPRLDKAAVFDALQAEKQTLQQVLEAERASLRRLEAALLHQKGDHDVSLQENVTLRAKLRDQKEEISILESRVEQQENALSKIEFELALLQNELIKEEQRREKLEFMLKEESQTTIQNLMTTIKVTIEQLEDQKSTKLALEKTILKAEETIGQLETSLNKVSDEYDRLICRISDHKSKRDRLQESVDTLTSERQETKLSLDAETSEQFKLKQQKLSQETQLQSSIDQVRSGLTVLKNNCESEIQKLGLEKLSLETENEKANSDLKSVQSKCSNLNDKESKEVLNIEHLTLESEKFEEKLQTLMNEKREKHHTLQELNEEILNQSKKIAAFEIEVRENENLRRKLHNMVQELKGNIRVFCRLRPQMNVGAGQSKEPIVGGADLYEVDNGNIYAFQPLGQARDLGQGRDNDSSQRQSWKFSFDHVFGPHHSQEDVFNEVSQVVQSAMDGYRVCLFAYGQTGSGKTHTMMGSYNDNGRNLGVIPRSVQGIFEHAEKLKDQGWTFDLKASFVEIYNESVRDLLCDAVAANNKQYDIKIDRDTMETYVNDVVIKNVGSPQEIQALIEKSMKNRSTAATSSNDRSSRSHSVFRLKIFGQNSITRQETKGLLNLIDLAGSERLKQSKSEGDRLVETQHINKSLSALGDVIAALANKEKHVPYRNSKLTYLLQDSLGGDSKTLMFVNLSPAEESFGESLASLRFASKVNSCDIGTAKKSTKVDLNVFD